MDHLFKVCAVDKRPTVQVLALRVERVPQGVDPTPSLFKLYSACSKLCAGRLAVPTQIVVGPPPAQEIVDR